MANTPRAHRAKALAAAAAVAGTVAVTVINPSAAFSADLRQAGLNGPVTMRAGVFSAVPVVQSITPALGPVDGGTAVTVVGSGFRSIDTADETAVRFGDVPASRFVVLSDTKLIAVTPAAAVGAVRVTIVNSSGANNGRTASFGYRMSLGAEFESVTAAATGGAQILAGVTGGGLGATARDFIALRVTALVGDVAAVVSWVSPEQVRITVPATAKLGAAQVRLLHDGFAGPRSTATVTYLPGVTSVTPNRINVEGGDLVKIVGAGFGSVDPEDLTAVTFGGVPAQVFLVRSDTVIEAVAPEGDGGPAAVRVTTASGASLESAAARVSYVGPLGLDTSGGAFVRADGGRHTLAVTGGTLGADAREFAASGISLLLGKVKIPVTWVDPTHLSVSLPPQTGVSSSLTLVNGTVSSPVTLPVAPVVAGLSATTDTIAGGRTVTVRTAGAATATDFRFGSAEAACTGGNHVYVCVVPPADEAGPVRVSFTSGTDVASGFTATSTFSYTDID
jgi:hypothetical protein